jgi:hypothetical protein
LAVYRSPSSDILFLGVSSRAVMCVPGERQTRHMVPTEPSSRDHGSCTGDAGRHLRPWLARATTAALRQASWNAFCGVVAAGYR